MRGLVFGHEPTADLLLLETEADSRLVLFKLPQTALASERERLERVDLIFVAISAHAKAEELYMTRNLLLTLYQHKQVPVYLIHYRDPHLSETCSYEKRKKIMQIDKFPRALSVQLSNDAELTERLELMFDHIHNKMLSI